MSLPRKQVLPQRKKPVTLRIQKVNPAQECKDQSTLAKVTHDVMEASSAGNKPQRVRLAFVARLRHVCER